MTAKRYRAIAEYYDAEYADSEMLRQDVPFFLGQLPSRRQSVLELCVGTARAAIPIAQAGHRVVGVDYAADLLHIARRKMNFAGVIDRHLSLLEGDVLSLNLDQKFDWVCLFFNTLLAFPTLAEQDTLLQAARAHLKPRGRFWLDIFQPDLSLLARGDVYQLEPHAFYVHSLDRAVFQTTSIAQNRSRQIQEVTFEYVWFDAGGNRHGQKNRFQMTWLFQRELQLLLERNGLKIERLFGNYDGSNVTDDSPRLIARCVRA